MKCYNITVMYWAVLCAGNKSEGRQHCAHDKPADKAARGHCMGLGMYQLPSFSAPPRRCAMRACMHTKWSSTSRKRGCAGHCTVTGVTLPRVVGRPVRPPGGMPRCALHGALFLSALNRVASCHGFETGRGRSPTSVVFALGFK